jgi:hypothetical protein
MEMRVLGIGAVHWALGARQTRHRERGFSSVGVVNKNVSSKFTPQPQFGGKVTDPDYGFPFQGSLSPR